MPNAGTFKIEVSDPWPCWCRLFYRGELVLQFHHNEISDLEYVIERAKREAIRKLGKARDEV